MLANDIVQRYDVDCNVEKCRDCALRAARNHCGRKGSRGSAEALLWAISIHTLRAAASSSVC